MAVDHALSAAFPQIVIDDQPRDDGHDRTYRYEDQPRDFLRVTQLPYGRIDEPERAEPQSRCDRSAQAEQQAPWTIGADHAHELPPGPSGGNNPDVDALVV